MRQMPVLLLCMLLMAGCAGPQAVVAPCPRFPEAPANLRQKLPTLDLLPATASTRKATDPSPSGAQ